MHFLKAASKISYPFGAGVCGGAIGYHLFANGHNAAHEKNLQIKITQSIQPALEEIKKEHQKICHKHELEIAAIRLMIPETHQRGSENQPRSSFAT